MSGDPVVLRCGQPDAVDLDAFVARLVRLDRTTLVRLRLSTTRAGYLAAYARLPFDVLVGRAVRGTLDSSQDLTVSAAELSAVLSAVLAAPAAGTRPRPELDDPESEQVGVILPERRDQSWRGPLPPPAAWRRLDAVPVGAVRRLVSAGIATFREAQTRMVDPRVGQAAAQALLDHETLTVSDGPHEVVLPLRVLHAAWRMGFLGERDDADCVVSVAGRWARLAAPFGTAYRDSGGLGLLTP